MTTEATRSCKNCRAKRWTAAVGAIILIASAFVALNWAKIATCVSERLIYWRYYPANTSFSFTHKGSGISAALHYSFSGGAWSSFSDRIVRAWIGGPHASLELMRDVGSLSEITSITFCDIRFSDPTLSQLENLRHVERLGIEGSKVDDAGFEQISQMHTIEDITLARVEVTGGQIRALSKLPRLKRLSLYDAVVNSDVISAINTLPHLEWLTLQGSTVRDEDLQAFSEDCHISVIDLSHTAIGDEGIVAFRKLPRLRGWIMDDTRITDRSLPVFEEIRQRIDADTK